TALASMGKTITEDPTPPRDAADKSKRVTNLFIKYLLMLFRDLYPFVCSRKWTLWTATSPTSFITSDQPVALVGTFPGKELAGRGGFDNRHTALVMPLSQSLAVEGRFEAGRGNPPAD